MKQEGTAERLTASEEHIKIRVVRLPGLRAQSNCVRSKPEGARMAHGTLASVSCLRDGGEMSSPDEKSDVAVDKRKMCYSQDAEKFWGRVDPTREQNTKQVLRKRRPRNRLGCGAIFH